MVHIPGFNYCGPGTTSHNKPPRNRVDAICMEHDLAYARAKSNCEFKKKADLAFLQRLNELSNLTCKERIGRFLCSTAIRAKMFLQRSKHA